MAFKYASKYNSYTWTGDVSKELNHEYHYLIFCEHVEEEQLNVWGGDSIFCDTDLYAYIISGWDLL